MGPGPMPEMDNKRTGGNRLLQDTSVALPDQPVTTEMPISPMPNGDGESGICKQVKKALAEALVFNAADDKTKAEVA